MGCNISRFSVRICHLWEILRLQREESHTPTKTEVRLFFSIFLFPCVRSHPILVCLSPPVFLVIRLGLRHYNDEESGMALCLVPLWNRCYSFVSRYFTYGAHFFNIYLLNTCTFCTMCSSPIKTWCPSPHFGQLAIASIFWVDLKWLRLLVSFLFDVLFLISMVSNQRLWFLSNHCKFWIHCFPYNDVGFVEPLTWFPFRLLLLCCWPVSHPAPLSKI